jgi:ABC-type spermidine/putrescine transport system permease subunit I
LLLIVPEGPLAHLIKMPLARSSRELTKLVACIPAVSLVLFIIVAPIAWLFFLSFKDEQGFTLRHYQRMLDNPGYETSLETTLFVSFVVTLLSAVLAYPVAYLLKSLSGKSARIVLVVVLLPLWTALPVRPFAWLVPHQRESRSRAPDRQLPGSAVQHRLYRLNWHRQEPHCHRHLT